MKKIKILLVALILILGVMMVVTTSYASDERTTKNLSYQLERPYNDDNNDTTVGNDIYKFRSLKDSRELLYAVVKIFNSDASESEKFNDIFYCLRRGKGFGSVEDTNNPTGSTTYNVYEDMKANASEIIEAYNALYSINLDTEIDIEFNDKTYQDVNLYNAILWIADNAYLPTDSENYIATEYKTELLNKVGIIPTQHELITDDDLEVVQQLAFWFFTNYDEGNNVVYPSQFLGICTAPGYEVDNDVFSTRRAKYIDMLYEYFIVNSMEASVNYTREASTEISNIKFDKSVEFAIDNSNVSNSDSEVINPYNSFYKVGPFKLNYDDPRIADKLEIKLKDKNGKIINSYYNRYNEEFERWEKIVIFKIINETGDVVTSIAPNVNYYIKIYSLYDGSNEDAPISIDFSAFTLEAYSTYYLSNANFLSTGSGNDQAVIEINKEKISTLDEITTELPKEFDLSLRKFITSINGQELKEEDSRVPNINTNTLINGITNRKGEKEYTATYTHPKNALKVEKGDKVVYTIRIYNEGELDGTATKVTDYLPVGLELVPASESTINDKYGWKPSAGDDIIIETNYLANTTIKAFDKTLTKETAGAGWQEASQGVSGLYYADLQVECIVKADATGEDQSLRNIAAITEDTGDDRDSVPGDPGRDDYNPPADNSTYKEDDDDYEDLVLPTKKFDLALRKYIVAVNDKVLSGADSRVPNIDITPLKQSETTADYKHRKDPVEVEVGDIVTYRFTVYNEGDIHGYVYSITDYLPEGLTFEPELNTNFIERKENNDYEEEDLEDKEYEYIIEGNELQILPRTIGMVKIPETNDILFGLKAFDGSNLDSKSIDIKFKVTAKNTNNDQILTNVATMNYGSQIDFLNQVNIPDRDSKGEEFTVPSQEQLVSESETAYKGNTSNKDELNDSTYHYEGQQDDDDFEKIVIKGKPFDLSLRKFITSIKRNGREVEFDDRTPSIDTTTLINGTFERNGQKEHTATYEHSKEPLVVKKGDIVTYTLRIYNEGERAGYATEITDYIPEGLALILNYNTNFDNGWKLQENFDYDKQLMNLVGEKGFYATEEEVKNLKLEDFEDTKSLKDVQLATGKVTITTPMLQDELIKAFDKEKTTEETGWQKAEKGEGGLYYKDIQVSCLVIAENTCKVVLTNIAEISEDKDEYKQDIIDRDSEPDNVANKNEDDDDYEPVILRYFDLALRKFITGVETNGKTENVTSRIPVPKMGEDGNIVYEHSKDPVKVANNDTVIYTIRVYNEGTLAGYAEEITDDIPEGLEYIPEHSVNKQYEWKMYDKDGKITENVEEAVKITTDYLSEEKEVKSKMTITDETTGEKTTPTNTRDNLIAPFDSSKAISNEKPLNPDYRDVKVAFKVAEPDTSDRIIVNSAQISKDSDDDEDSVPGKWNEGEDDQDREYIYVKYFDLSLLKWVTQTIVSVDGKTTTTETGFKPNTGKTETTGIRDNSEAEPIAKVEIDRKKLKNTTVKFVYNIKVTNEGEIAGYATEITDYIPEGLEFLSEDNKAFGWEKDGTDKVTTRALETVLLKPGESATVKIVFRWKNDANNLGVKTNIAEISEDYNEHNSKDIDSEPDNKQKPYTKEQEDDDDFALVILSIKTGKGVSYTILIISMLTLLAGGMYLIKKYVLRY